MTILSIVVGAIVGIIIGVLLPVIPYTASKYLAIAIVAALDTVLGGLASNIKKNFNMKVFLSGFFVNAIFAVLLTFLGERLNLDIYLAAVFVFVSRIFNNLGTIRRYYLTKFTKSASGKKSIAKSDEN